MGVVCFRVYKTQGNITKLAFGIFYIFLVWVYTGPDIESFLTDLGFRAYSWAIYTP